MNIARRIFLKQGGLALASVGLAPTLGPLFLRRTVYAAAPQRLDSKAGGKKILICLFQRGAVDGLSMVVPHGDADYYQHRNVGGGGIALARTGQDGIVDLDGFFGLHPALAPLKPIYDSGHLAPIHAVGSPDSTRSHFDAQDYMESGTPGNKSVRDGWLARTLLHCPEDRAKLGTPFRGVALTGQVPRSLQGKAEALAIPDLKTFGVQGDPGMTAMAMGGGRGMTAAGGFEAMYDQAVGDVLHGAGKESFEAIKMLEGLKSAGYVPSGGAQYPNGKYGQSLMQIAQLIKADVGVEVAFAESGGWDTHVNQGAAQGQLARRLTEFGQGLAALYADLGDKMSDVVILTMSEFGRTARQNGNGGTDHGHATCFFALGGDVNGGKVLGQWPGLASEKLNDDRDLALTTDFRDVFGEVASKHLGVTDLRAVFPGYAGGVGKFRGVLRA